MKCLYCFQSNQTDYNGHISSVGSVSASYASCPEIDPSVWHILLRKNFPSLADSRRASCQLLAKMHVLVNCLWEACPETVWLSN